jgi:hypothetical protein
MKLSKIPGDGLAILAILIALTSLVLTMIGLETRNWTWSKAMLTLTAFTSCITIFLIAPVFRSRPRAVYLLIALIVLNFLVYVVFNRNPAEF